jgi:tetratricopeptide (TPR) repeat protein
MRSMLERAVALDPAFAAAWTELARTHITQAFYRSGDQAAHLKAAKDAIDRAQLLAPDSPEVEQALGDYYLFGLRDFPNATVHLTRLLALEPGSAEANLSLGLVERRQGHWERAVELFRRARELDPRNPNPVRLLLTTLDWGARNAEAGAIYAEISAAHLATQSEELEQRENDFLLTGDPAGVEAWFAGLDPAVRSSPEIVSFEKAWAWARGENARFLRLSLPGSLPVDPDNAEEINDQAMVLTQLGQTDRARALLEPLRAALAASVAADPTDQDHWMELGTTLALLGKFPEALAASDRAISILPESLDHVNGMDAGERRVAVLALCGRKADAIRELAKRLRVPGNYRVEYLATSIEWLSLRGEPAFQALIKDPANRGPRF